MKKLASWETIKELIKITKEEFSSLQNSKVDKVEGKGLSTYDYNDSAKAKVDAIPDDPKYTDTIYDDSQLYDDMNSSLTNFESLLDSYAFKDDIKTKLSEMEEDSTHRTVTDAEKSEWNNKVDKVSGKGLSSNDFSNTYKSKLDNLTSTNTNSEATTSDRGYMSASDKTKLNGIETGATKYTHPSSHPISMISGLQAELDSKIDSYGTNAVLNIAVISAGGSTTSIPNNTLILELE